MTTRARAGGKALQLGYQTPPPNVSRNGALPSSPGTPRPEFRAVPVSAVGVSPTHKRLRAVTVRERFLGFLATPMSCQALFNPPQTRTAHAASPSDFICGHHLSPPKIHAIMGTTMHRRPTGQIVGALAVLLVLAHLQCFAACMVMPCDSLPEVVKLPPCHRHQPDSGTHDRTHCPRQTWVTSPNTAPNLIGAALQPSHVVLQPPIVMVPEDPTTRSDALPLDHSPPGSPVLRI